MFCLKKKKWSQAKLCCINDVFLKMNLKQVLLNIWNVLLPKRLVLVFVISGQQCLSCKQRSFDLPTLNLKVSNVVVGEVTWGGPHLYWKGNQWLIPSCHALLRDTLLIPGLVFPWSYHMSHPFNHFVFPQGCCEKVCHELPCMS